MKEKQYKPKVMLHYILPPNTSGPNTSMERLENSWLNDYYFFGQLIQDERPGKTFNFRLLKKMIKQVRAFGPDIIHVSGLQSGGFYGVLAARLGGCSNIITTVHGSSVEAIGFNPLYKILYRYLIEPLTMMLSRKVYTVCHDMSNKFGICNRSNFSGVIHNPAPLIEQQQINRVDFREEASINEDSVIVTCVGRMTYDKGISYAIEAIKQIETSQVVFVFVGDGPYYDILRKELKKEINEKRVFVLGKRNDVLRILAASDVFLFPTLHENLSNALLEACSMNLSVIATSVGGNKEVIKNEINGLLIPPNDSRAIVDAVNRLYRNKDEIKKYGEAAKRNVKENFSQEIIFKKIKQMYDSTLQG